MKSTRAKQRQPNTHIMATSIKTLEALCGSINEATDSPSTPYTRTASGLKANLGNYHLSRAYGGVCVQRMDTEGGGVSTPIWCGYVPKREAEGKMRAFLRGLEAR
jgi:hypothetical protein